MIPIDFGAMKTGNKTIKQGRGVNRPYGVGKMANRKQLAMLEQGVVAWNRWREEHPNVKIDLRGAKLDGKDLSGANFRFANISSASFQKSILIGTDFSISIATTERTIAGKISHTCSLCLSGIYFLVHKYLSSIATIITIVYIVIYLSNYPLFIVLLLALIMFWYFVINYNLESTINISKRLRYNGTDFKHSNLTNAIFDDAYINNSIFDDAMIRNTSFVNTKGLSCISCKNTILDTSDVKKLLFSRNGQQLNLKGIDLYGAYLFKACLQHVDLRETRLICTNLREADITGAKLWGSARENWIIDSIRCEYVYWDEAGTERTPPDRDFRPGEFEELYKQLHTFEYIFEQGFTPLDPLIMERVVQAVNERHKEFSLELVNFDKRGQPHATFTVCRLDYVDAARKSVTEIYEKTIEYLMQENEEKNRLIERQNNFIDQLIKKTPSIEDLKKMGDTYNNYGQTGAMGKNASASGNTFQQITADLSRLHEEMQRSAKTPEQRAAAEDVAKAAQAAREKDEPAMWQHLKKTGRFALDCAKTVGTDVAAEYLKKVTLGM
ncbi:MAG: pentapeptide repeat-containing protein [Candidatus Electronema sp. V4]|uniref:pentapeptide repeat-containing protein n=1 Tax=Candidatus Electronema sp. V4 TaxID=3454756 RepID=UPI00405544D7